jgi:pilus assembly protein FimV
LGEPLKAEIEILDINAEEAATLSTRVAAPEAFKAAGLDYNAAISGLQTTLQRRPDGRAFIKLSSDRIVNEPFVDLILEASWNTGRIMRDYTMLFDPPSLRDTTATGITPAQASAVAAPTAQKPVLSASQGALVPTATAPVAATRPTPKKPANDADTQKVTVKPGDTASRIATAHQAANVSLDQMLVAMLRSSPDAFIGGNINRIKAGALLTLPSEAEASTTAAPEAKQIILAQSQNFNNFRHNLAASAPVAKVTPSTREASGKLQANVQDKKPTAATPDKLTLTKGAVTSKSNEDQVAQARNAKVAASRTAEVAKNLKDLSQIAAASSASALASAPKPAQPIAVPVVATPVSASPPTSAAVLTASAPAKPASKVVATASAPAPATASESSFIDNLLEDPIVPAGAVGLIALLAGLGFYKVRQRKQVNPQDSAFIDSKLHSDSFFGNSGGKNVNTSDSGVTGSSMIYSPSQLDAVDDVDPVAEADVYLAYGRDLQAEEILKDALRTKPERLAIHQKLLEIYAKRRDAKAYEAIATLAFNLTNGIGSDWDQVCEKGLALEPNNALYLPGGQPQFDTSAVTSPAGIDTVSPGTGADVADASAQGGSTDSSAMNLDLDLDLDFSLDEPDLPDGVAESPKALEPAQDADPLPTIEVPHNDENSFESEPEPLELLALQAALNQSTPVVSPPTTDFQPTNMSAPDNDIDFDKTQVLSVPKQQEAPAKNSGMMEFDLGSLSLDFENTNRGELSNAHVSTQSFRVESDDDSVTQPGAFPEVTGDPLETKLALAEEFKAIGDDDGARALIEEVIAESSGDMKVKAQQALNKL